LASEKFVINVTGTLMSSRRHCNTWTVDGAFRQSHFHRCIWPSMRYFQLTLWSHLPICSRPRWQVWVES